MSDVTKTQRYSFIHIPRTSGVYAIEVLQSNGYHIVNSWPNLKRDWTTMEMLQHLKKFSGGQKTIMHNHSLGWSEDLVDASHYYGFTSFAIIRNPLEQYPSIYKRFFMKDISWEDFLDDCLEGPQRYQFIVPSYYKKIQLLIKYENRMDPALEQTFDIKSDNSRSNASPKSDFKPTEQDFERIKRSEVYGRYMECMDAIVKCESPSCIPL